MSRVALAIGLLAALAGCAGEPHRQVNGGYSLPPRATSAPPPTQAMRPAPQVEPSEAVWHLRAGLNVAALSCRGSGRTPVAAHYARLLSHHKALLAQAYSNEQRRYGKGLDRHQTQLYNRFSNQRNPAKFCSTAASVAREAGAMDSPSLARNASGLLGRIA
ncbi:MULTISPECIES: hypothetical protein [unclassified Novosphingobium]|uniref:hypothetical protein n=1 Tax=unclassified Novosphingobium TaxID=2644732 RepID=UPI000ECB2BFB|nr:MULTISPECIES: hypothetical protein [unclassified Novosphingobium]HCF24076.1 hypothetical protein [Novosphingobium sp.]HQV04410.1 hypothetical protein [Novosphingobium sp.]